MNEALQPDLLPLQSIRNEDLARRHRRTQLFVLDLAMLKKEILLETRDAKVREISKSPSY